MEFILYNISAQYDMHACIRLAVQCTQNDGAIVCNNHNNNVHYIIYDIRPYCYYK